MNVSIRINSPGDDGPVTQINAAGGDVVSVVHPPAQGPSGPAPAPAAPPVSALPDNWTWIWTSACFGGGGGGGAQPASAATAGPSWHWEWSCGAGDTVGGLPLPRPDAPGVPAPIAAGGLQPSPVDAGDVVPSVGGVLPAEFSGAPPPRAHARQ
ncbi:MAG TPA: hypothetical protein VFM58_22135, partial [Solirubrobacteraceae bacterium]|nr:hypothetical protein [Solirubrobacteraceae bacterium]